ncbi:MAG TPA: site-2 protease family protein, partial [Gemmatimonadaceae bacterium]
MHSAALKTIAGEADAAKARGDLLGENAQWQRALDLLPYNSQQHSAIRARIADITRLLASEPKPSVAGDPSAPWHKRFGAGLAGIIVILLSKAKFLLLGLTKLKTLLSMFAFFGVYWSLYGWGFALGLVLTIYIHEMGHVFVLRRLGVEATAPMFIPGLGAFILSKRRIDNPVADARVGLAGPVWGLGAGIIAWGAYLWTGQEVIGAVAAVTGFINLFNLIPIWQLDGSHAFRALATWQRWALVAAVAAAFYLTRQNMLLAVGGVAIYRAFQKTDFEGDRTALATFVVLVFSLALLSG